MSRSKLILATRNPGKLAELQAMLASLAVEVLSLDAFPDLPEVNEDGATFSANAIKKAVAAAGGTGLPAIADDSGLEVAALDGAPGVYSARFGGSGLDDAGRMDHLLGELAARGLDRSPARFVTVVALATPAGEWRTSTGTWPGTVIGPPRGEHGFGYDPIFVPAGDHRTAAMLSPAEKNALSHRARAFAAMRQILAAEPDWLATGGSGI